MGLPVVAKQQLAKVRMTVIPLPMPIPMLVKSTICSDRTVLI
jgi:hypothetical protein